MAIPPETEWVLIASGLIAHADGTIDGNEAERLMSIVDDEIGDDDYADWLQIIGDKAALEDRYAKLPDPPTEQHRPILEEAWTMAMVDGERSTEELLVLTQIAERLGVDPMQLQFWREAWTEAEREFASRVAELAVLALGGGEALFEDDHSPYLDLVERLPTSNEERERLRGLAEAPPEDRDGVCRALAALSRNRRTQAFEFVAPLARDSVAGDAAREQFIELGKTAGLLDVEELL